MTTSIPGARQIAEADSMKLCLRSGASKFASEPHDLNSYSGNGLWRHVFNWLLMLAALLLVSPAFGAGLSVEQVQRDFQIRHKMIRGDYVTWPKCSAGTTPAPHFPKDGFYGDLNEDPDKGVEVVRNLYSKFYGTQTRIYESFVKAPNGYGDLENVSDFPPNYAPADVGDGPPSNNPETYVTTANYPERLREIAGRIRSLLLIKVTAEQVIDVEITNPEFGFKILHDERDIRSFSEVSCEAAKQCVISMHSTINMNPEWAKMYEFEECVGGETFFDPSIPGTKIQSAIITEVLSTGFNSLFVNNRRGKIRADLTPYKRGNAKVFLKLGLPPINPNVIDYATFGQPRPTSENVEVNKWGVWEEGILKLGANLPTEQFVTHSDSVQELNCSEAPIDVRFSNGWEVNEAVAVVSPDFTTITPDPKDCCSPCTECIPGTLTTSLKSVHVNIDLGPANYGNSAGSVILSADSPSPQLTTLAALRFTYDEANVVVNPEPPALPDTRLQFKTSQALTDIQVNTAYKYTIATYSSGNFTPTEGGNGFYPPTGPASSTIVIENPDASPTVYNRLRVTYTKTGSPSVVSEYVYTEATQQWELFSGGEVNAGGELISALRRESRAWDWTSNPTLPTETVMIKSFAGDLIYKEVNTYQFFPWGMERTKQVVDPDPGGAQLTSEWFYYDDPGQVGKYGQLHREIDPKGHWVKYDYDSAGRETKRTTQFLDAALESADDLNRVIETTYSTTTNPQRTIITIVEKLLNEVIGRRYRVVYPDEVLDIVRPVNSDEWDDPEVNLVTTTKRIPSGTFEGETQSIENPDGTMQIFLPPVISSGTRTDTVESGHPDTEKTDILDGTRTVTVKNSVGQLISRTVTDIVSGETLASETYSNYDSFNRPRRVTYADETFVDTEYIECCGVSAVTDRDGVRTEYLYDKLNRLVATMRLEVPGGSPQYITETNMLDAAGNVRVTKRIGTDDTHKVLRRFFYDPAGRITKETNALNGVTTFSETSNGTVKTTTYPDGGVRTETYYKDGALKRIEGTATFPVYYDYGRGGDGVFTKETKGSVAGPEWTKAYTDFAGRQYKTVFAKATEPFPYSQSFFNAKGQLWKQRDPDDVITLSKFNAKGEQEYSILALTVTARELANYEALESQLSTLLSGNDRITRTVSDVVANVSAAPSPAVPARRTRVWAHADDSSTEVKVSMTETSTDGLRTWQTRYRNASTPVVTQTQTVFGDNDGVPAARYRTATTTQSDSTRDVTVFYQGRVNAVKRKPPTGGPVTQNTYAYNSHGLQSATTDLRNGTATYFYNNADQIERLTSPAPGTGQGTQTITNFYNNMLQLTSVSQADGASVVNNYTRRGELQAVFGSRVYPVGYSYDSQGRLKTMTNWSGFTGFTGKRITTWNYNPERGWLENKRYPDATTGNPSSIGVDYEYTAAGRIAKRKWARGAPRIETIYAYNLAGEMTGVSYTDGVTPNITFTLIDRRGRQKTVTRNGITTTRTYNDADQLTGESYAGGTLDGRSVTPGYDAHLRRDTLSISTSPALNFSYGYDTVSRLQTVADGSIPATANSATYSYIPDSPLAGTIQFKQAGSLRMTTTRQYDKLNRLSSVDSVGTLPTATGVSPLSYAYRYNDANQRVQVRQSDSSRWVYQYDKLGQVISGKKIWSDGTPVAGQQFEYAFDDIGNRTSTKVGGNSSWTGLRSANYTVNALNQYTQRGVPNALDVLGLVKGTTASVTINSSAADYKRGEYFQETLSVANSAQAVWQSVTVNPGVPADVKTGNLFVPKTPELFDDPATSGINEGYDLDGNQLRDGRWSYTWDAENRLTKVEALSAIPDGAKKKVECEYDWLGRRIRKKSYNWNPSTPGYDLSTDQKFIYDGWNLVAILAADNSRVQSFTWGYDLSGTLQGAGGVGGLKSLTVHTGPEAGTYFCAYDGNGNVAGLVNASSGGIAAQYEYGPFGEIIGATGPMAKVNPFRFSTKYQDDETDLLYYGFRYYTASTGRWLSRDPIEEGGGDNLYAFVGNAPISLIDVLGQRELTASENALLKKLEEFAQKSGQKDPEFEKAMNAVIKDIRALIGSVKGEADPATLRIGLTSLKVWANPQESKLYSSKLQGTVTCNKYVADVVAKEGFRVRRFRFNIDRGIPGTGNWHDPAQVNNFKVVWTVAAVKGRKTQVEWNQLLKGKGTRQPAFGDVISYPGHVGIYLGRKIYISSTTHNPYEQAQSNDVPIHFINESEDQLYRSPQ